MVAVKDDKGKIKLHQAVNLTAHGAVSGGFWGALVGLIFLNPLLGMAVGATAGAVSGGLADVGIDDKFMGDGRRHAARELCAVRPGQEGHAGPGARGVEGNRGQGSQNIPRARGRLGLEPVQDLVPDAIVAPEPNQLLTLGLKCRDPEVGDAFEELGRGRELIGRRELLQADSVEVTQERDVAFWIAAAGGLPIHLRQRGMRHQLRACASSRPSSGSASMPRQRTRGASDNPCSTSVVATKANTSTMIRCRSGKWSARGNRVRQCKGCNQ